MLQSRMERDDKGELQVTPFVVQSLYEAQEKMECKCLLGDSKATFHNSGASVFEWFAVGYCVTTSRCGWDLNLRSEGAEPVELLVCGLRFRGEVCGSIEKLTLNSNLNGQEAVVQLKEMPPKVLR